MNPRRRNPLSQQQHAQSRRRQTRPPRPQSPDLPAGQRRQNRQQRIHEQNMPHRQVHPDQRRQPQNHQNANRGRSYPPFPPVPQPRQRQRRPREPQQLESRRRLERQHEKVKIPPPTPPHFSQQIRRIQLAVLSNRFINPFEKFSRRQPRIHRHQPYRCRPQRPRQGQVLRALHRMLEHLIQRTHRKPVPGPHHQAQAQRRNVSRTSPMRERLDSLRPAHHRQPRIASPHGGRNTIHGVFESIAPAVATPSITERPHPGDSSHRTNASSAAGKNASNAGST